MAKKNGRKKVNFMVDNELLVRFYEIIPAGKRSDFINKSLDKALIDWARRKASDDIDALAREAKIKMTTEEFIKLKNYGRP